MNEQIKLDLIKSMKEQNKFKTSVLRMLKSAIQSESINKNKDLTNEEILSVIKKQVKVRESSIEEFIKFNRTDLADNLIKEIDLLKSYLPENLSDEELNKIIDEEYNKINPTSMKEMGIIIKNISRVVGARADMSQVSKIVKSRIVNAQN